MKNLNTPVALPNLSLTDKWRENTIKTLLSPLIVDTSKLIRIRDAFLEEIKLGLSANPERSSSLRMDNTYVPDFTNGTEDGTYLALDLGGTNFRVMYIRLIKGVIENEEVVYYDIPKHLFSEEGTKLFDFIASSIADFITKKSLPHSHYTLGFTFSFPTHLTEIDVGISTGWTKSFSCSGVKGKNVVQLLQDAIKRKTDLDITVTAITNDATGTLIYGSYFDKRSAIGIILGTGNNACYLEKMSNIHKWEDKNKDEAIVDIEWGAFGDNGILEFLRTKWDAAVEDKSTVKKSYTFEKYLGGKYLGCIVREVLVTLAKERLFCKGSSKHLETHEMLKTVLISKIESETFNGGTSFTKEVLTKTLGLESVTDDDAKIAQYVSGLISYRAALLVGFLASILINRIDKPHCTVAIDGSIFEHHPRFRPLMEHVIETNSPGKSFNLLLAKDGSGKGAGLIAAILERLRKSKTNYIN